MPKRILEGVVVSDKGDKTVIVKVERTFLHPVLKKTVRRSKKYHAHDEANTSKAGEVVRIIECAPKSKTKTWEVLPTGSAHSPRNPAGEAGAVDDRHASARLAAEIDARQRCRFLLRHFDGALHDPAHRLGRRRAESGEQGGIVDRLFR